jgi:recombinational DNA repair protein RecT
MALQGRKKLYDLYGRKNLYGFVKSEKFVWFCKTEKLTGSFKQKFHWSFLNIFSHPNLSNKSKPSTYHFDWMSTQTVNKSIVKHFIGSIFGITDCVTFRFQVAIHKYVNEFLWVRVVEVAA